MYTVETQANGFSPTGDIRSWFRAMPLSELLEESKHPPEWLVEGMVPFPSFLLMVGRPKTYKSLLAQEMAIAVATGTPVMGSLQVLKPRTVLYVQEESTRHDFGRRLKRILAGRASDPVSDEETLHAISNTGLRLENQQHIEALAAEVERVGASLVIFDSLRELHDGDENDSTEIMKSLRPLKELRDRSNVTVLVVHHAGKYSESDDAGNAPRGSTAIGATVDGLIKVRNRKGKSTVSLQLREGGAANPFSFSPVFEPDVTRFEVEVNGEVTEINSLYEKFEWAILYKLRDHGEMGIKDLGSLMGKSERRLRPRLRALESRGHVAVRSEPTAKTTKNVFRITSEGESTLGNGRHGSQETKKTLV